MTRINTNVAAISAIRHANANYADLNLRIERLATGLRINRGADDPAALIVSENLRSEIRKTEQAIDNSIRVSSVVSTAEGALNEVSALLLNLQSLIVASANDGGLIEEELAANQLEIDSILASIDRIGNTTTFGQQKLLDGSKAYILSSVAPAALASVAMFSARMSQGGTRQVVVRVTQSAQTAQTSFIGTNAAGPSTTSATTIEVKGTIGSELLTFGSGTTLADIRTAINNATPMTGVSAVVSAASVAGVASALVLNSTTFGSDAFVSVQPIGGNFITSANGNTSVRSTGVDAGVLIDGQPASVKGLRADVRSNGLDTRIYLTESFGQTLSSTSFDVTGGGAVFQIAPEISPNGQLFASFNRVSTTSLGNAVTGLLHTLRSGETNDLGSRNYATAQTIAEEAISQVASYRGRLGSLLKDHINPNIDAQHIARENITASESLIRDAEIAVEVSALTRAQILVQSTQTTLRIATSAPQMVLALLQ